MVQHNDLAYDPTSPNPFTACPTSPTDSGDCGEGIHLLATTYSRVTGNQVVNNVEAILLSDGGLNPTSIGPAAHNVIAFNTSSDNAFDCGITLPGHDPRAVATTGPSAGQPQPVVAGVYDNLVKDNVANNNGRAGLLDAMPHPGTAAYDNSLVRNIVVGNGRRRLSVAQPRAIAGRQRPPGDRPPLRAQQQRGRPRLRRPVDHGNHPLLGGRAGHRHSRRG